MLYASILNKKSWLLSMIILGANFSQRFLFIRFSEQSFLTHSDQLRLV